MLVNRAVGRFIRVGAASLLMSIAFLACSFAPQPPSPTPTPTPTPTITPIPTRTTNQWGDCPPNVDTSTGIQGNPYRCYYAGEALYYGSYCRDGTCGTVTYTFVGVPPSSTAFCTPPAAPPGTSQTCEVHFTSGTPLGKYKIDFVPHSSIGKTLYGVSRYAWIMARAG
jgi:hypothetical protein